MIIWVLGVGFFRGQYVNNWNCDCDCKLKCDRDGSGNPFGRAVSRQAKQAPQKIAAYSPAVRQKC